jgi:hypothetical protein
VVPTTGTYQSLFGPLNGSTSATTTSIINSAYKYTVARIGDGPFEAHWQPNGPPRYQTFSSTLDFVNSSGSNLANYDPNANSMPGFIVTTAGQSGGPNVFNGGGGASGTEVGQYALVLLVDGDVTSASQNTSNVYGVEIKWTWEVTPRDPTSVAYTMEPSVADLNKLVTSLNLLEKSPVARVLPTSGSAAMNFR